MCAHVRFLSYFIIPRNMFEGGKKKTEADKELVFMINKTIS